MRYLLLQQYFFNMRYMSTDTYEIYDTHKSNAAEHQLLV